MALGSYTFGTVAGVEKYIGYMVENRKYTEDSAPQASQVEAVLDEVSAEITAEIVKAGYPLKTAAQVLALAPRAAEWLASLNNMGACARVLMMHPTEADPEKGTIPNFGKIYAGMLAAVSSRLLSDLGLAKETEDSAYMWSGSYQDSLGRTKNPLFTRKDYDYPGVRDLTKPD